MDDGYEYPARENWRLPYSEKLTLSWVRPYDTTEPKWWQDILAPILTIAVFVVPPALIILLTGNR